MKDIVIIGAGGLGREVAQTIEGINLVKPFYNLRGFVVEEKYYEPDVIINGYPLLGTTEWLLNHKNEVYCHCAIGEPIPRHRIQENLTLLGCKFETIISPDLLMHPTVTIGEGSYIAWQCGLSVNIRIGRGVLLNGGIIVGHDVNIGDYSCIMTRTVLSGRVKIGNDVFIGGMTYIVPKVVVEDESVVAAGSVVYRKVKYGTHVLGNPAKRIEL